MPAEFLGPFVSPGSIGGRTREPLCPLAESNLGGLMPFGSNKHHDPHAHQHEQPPPPPARSAADDDDDFDLDDIVPVEPLDIPIAPDNAEAMNTPPNYGPDKINHVPPLGPLAVAAGGDAGPGGHTGAADMLSGTPGHKIRAFEQSLTKGHGEEHWKRTPQPTGTNRGAVHVKSFHCKLTGDSLEFLDNQINDWLDSHPEYEVKMVTTSIGEWTGKLKEPALIVNVWV
jgi:hypothetical protein